MRVINAGLVTILAMMIVGCVPVPRSRPAYVDLCHDRQKFQIQTRNGEKTFYLYTYLYNHKNRLKSTPYVQSRFELPYDRHERYFHVQLIGFNKDRKSPLKPGQGGEPAIPMRYDSRQAVIKMENGQTLQALPNLYLPGKAAGGWPLPSPETTRASPYDINSDEVHRIIPRLANRGDYGSIFVVFRTDAFNENARWTIDLGSLEVEGQKVQIAPVSLCFHPRKNWMGLEPLMRP